MLDQKTTKLQQRLPQLDTAYSLAVKGEAIAALLTFAHESEQVSKPSTEIVANAGWALSDYFADIRKELGKI